LAGGVIATHFELGVKFTLRELLFWKFIASLLALGVGGIMRARIKPPKEVIRVSPLAGKMGSSATRE
jgi:hypothetical protein